MDDNILKSNENLVFVYDKNLSNKIICYKCKYVYVYRKNLSRTENKKNEVFHFQNFIKVLKLDFLALNTLEVSTKSNLVLGRELSALNLKINLSGHQTLTVEELYQNSKIIINSKLVAFNYNGYNFPIEPKCFYYDWLYINALLQNKRLITMIFSYNSFTDIEFKLSKSINTQARAVCIFKYLIENKLIDPTKSKEIGLFDLYKIYPKSIKVTTYEQK